MWSWEPHLVPNSLHEAAELPNLIQERKVLQVPGDLLGYGAERALLHQSLHKKQRVALAADLGKWVL